MTDSSDYEEGLEVSIEDAGGFIQTRPLTALLIAAMLGALTARFVF